MLVLRVLLDEAFKAEQLALFGGGPLTPSARVGQLDLFGGDPTHGGRLVDRQVFTKTGHVQTFHVLPGGGAAPAKKPLKPKPAPAGEDLFAWASQATPWQVASALVDAHQQAKRPEATPEDIERRDQLLTAAQAHHASQVAPKPADDGRDPSTWDVGETLAMVDASADDGREVAVNYRGRIGEQATVSLGGHQFSIDLARLRRATTTEPMRAPAPAVASSPKPPEEHPAGTIFHGYTMDYQTQLQWARREDGQWFSRGQDKTPRGYRWSAWRKSGPPNERASTRRNGSEDTRIARLPKEGEAGAAANGMRIVPNKHTKTGAALWTVQLDSRVSSAAFDELREKARRAGGRWSSYAKDGAIPGFIFTDEASARRFVVAPGPAKDENVGGATPAGHPPPGDSLFADAEHLAIRSAAHRRASERIRATLDVTDPRRFRQQQDAIFLHGEAADALQAARKEVLNGAWGARGVTLKGDNTRRDMRIASATRTAERKASAANAASVSLGDQEVAAMIAPSKTAEADGASAAAERAAANVGKQDAPASSPGGYANPASPTQDEVKADPTHGGRLHPQKITGADGVTRTYWLADGLIAQVTTALQADPGVQQMAKANSADGLAIGITKQIEDLAADEATARGDALGWNHEHGRGWGSYFFDAGERARADLVRGVAVQLKQAATEPVPAVTEEPALVERPDPIADPKATAEYLAAVPTGERVTIEGEAGRQVWEKKPSGFRPEGAPDGPAIPPEALTRAAQAGEAKIVDGPPPQPQVNLDESLAGFRNMRLAELVPDVGWQSQTEARLQSALRDWLWDEKTGPTSLDEAGLEAAVKQEYERIRFPAKVAAEEAAAGQAKRADIERRQQAQVTQNFGKDLTPKQRENANSQALDTIRRAVGQGRDLTQKEMEQVALYSGKGGIGDSLNQYFTRPDIAAAMWDLLKHHGLPETGAKILEPACGSGVFLQTAPDGAHVTGVEIDPEVALVAKALHGARHTIHGQAFETFAVAREHGVGERFDAVITNAPFCTRTGDGARIHKPEHASADCYFIDTALDQVKEGGLVAMIVHKGVMANEGTQDFRRRMAERAEVVDAFRLPVEAFKHADTTVVSDVIILRKRPQAVANALRAGGEEVAKALGVHDEALIFGDFFKNKPERVLGTTAADWRGGETVEGDAAACAPAIRSLGTASWAHSPAGRALTVAELRDHKDERVQDALFAGLAQIEPPPAGRGSQTVIAGKTYILTPEPDTGELRWRRLDSIDDARELLNSGDSTLKSAGELALRYSDLRAALERGDYLRARGIRRKLQKDLVAWTGQYGIPGKHPELEALAQRDKNLAHLVGAVHADGSLADILTSDPVVAAPAARDRVSAKSVAEAAAHLATHAPREPITLAKIREAYPEASEEAFDALLKSGEYLDARGMPGHEEGEPALVHAEDYATGDLFALRDHEREQATSDDPETRARAEARLAVVQGAIDERWRPLEQIETSVRSGWVPPRVIEAWLNSEEGKDARGFHREYTTMHEVQDVKVLEAGGIYTVLYTTPKDGKRYKHSGEPDHGACRTILRYMNRLPISGERAREEAESLDRAFKTWLQSSDLRSDVEDEYNRRFTGRVPPRMNAAPIQIDGLRFDLHPYHYEQIRWNEENRGGVVAMDVGLGKTFNTIATARHLRLTGKARKVAVSCPKSVVINWQNEVRKLHPDAKIMVVGATSREKPKKTWRDPNVPEYVADTDKEETLRKKLTDIAANDYDMVLFTYEALARIPVRDENVQRFEEADFWSRRSQQLSGGEHTISQGRETSEKKLAAALAGYQAERAKLGWQHAQSIIHWEDLGVDCLFLDEAHNFANLGSPRSRGGEVKMMGSSDPNVKRSHDFRLKAALVRERRKPDEEDGAYQDRVSKNKADGAEMGLDGNGVFLLTATPAKNSPMDVYHLMLQATPNAWRQVGVRNLEEFIDRYVDVQQRVIINTNQKAEEHACAVGFKNLGELRGVMEGALRRRTAKEVGLPLPKADTLNHLVDLTPEQLDEFQAIKAEYEERKKDKDEKVASSATLWLLHNLQAAGTDLSLLAERNHEHAGRWKESPKYRKCVENVTQALKGGRGGQVIFIDRNESHTHIKNLLVAAGVPEDEIEILNAKTAADADKRFAISERFNQGKTRVVIGNTGTMGEGVNLQKKTSDLHHLDLPWSPGKYHQRNGRAVRQGNEFGEVRLHHYFAKRSFDSYRHAILSGKQGWVANLYSGADYAENTEEGEKFSPEELQVLLADDPEEARVKFEADRAKRMAAAQDAARAKAMRDWQGVMKRRTTYGRMRDKQTPAAQRLAHTIRVDVERLKRVTELPKELREGLDKEDMACVVVPRTGRIFKVGDVIKPTGAKLGDTGMVVTDVDPEKGAVSVREWGRMQRHYSQPTINSRELAGYEHHTGPEREVDLYRENVQERLAEARLKGKGYMLDTHIKEMARWPEDILKHFEPEARELATLRHAYHVEHASTIFAPDESGALRPVKANSEQGRAAKPLLPWGEDKDRLVEALAGHMRKRGKKWVQSKARGSHGYETYTPDWEWSLATRNATGEDTEYGGPVQAAKDRLTREDHPR